MAGPVASTDGHETATGGPFGIKGIAWAIFEWARNPYYNIVVIAIFSAYFGNKVVSDPVLGQTLVGLVITIAGVIMAITSPILGVITDKGGSKKKLLAIALSIIAGSSMLLWFVAPGVPGAVPLGMFLMIAAYCSYTVTELLHNSLLTYAGRPSALPAISGIGIGLGALAAVLMLVTIAYLTLNPPAALSNIPFALERGAALVCGIWLVVFIIPFFLFMPDHKGSTGSWRVALKQQFFSGQKNDPIGYVKEKIGAYPNVMRFLLARMLYADGVSAVFAIGSAYAGGVFGWGTLELSVLGLTGVFCAAVGGFLGGILDRTLGPKRSIILEMSIICSVFVAQLSLTPTSAFFGLVDGGQTIHSGAYFSTLSEALYIGLMIPAGIFIGANITSSRYMLLHLSPPDKLGEFFGFYSMAGSATVWVGPGMAALFTWLFASQRIGLGSVLILFFAGLYLLKNVQADKTPEHMKENPRY